MKINVTISGITTVNELDNYWSDEVRVKLLEEFGYPDASTAKPSEIQELLHMAITDFEPAEAAKILLNFKLGEELNEGQIQSLSHEMMADKVAEEYPDPALHYDLFNINQLLFKAYNGKFPNTEATIIQLELHPESKETAEVNKELITRVLCQGLSDRNIINRLYPDQISGKVAFEDAEKIIWQIREKGNNAYEVITSNYWIAKDDVIYSEYEAELELFDEEKEG
ncbi:hypothetical protein [Lunatibacter salilacus]|uniref:hypothetical protein n=1 Tax=Lunatibacter salilacus TaxID=2483804 RepID=UPI00131CE9FB|nr:hypothetical protein [Lunatibacter salilacus]